VNLTRRAGVVLAAFDMAAWYSLLPLGAPSFRNNQSDVKAHRGRERQASTDVSASTIERRTTKYEPLCLALSARSVRGFCRLERGPDGRSGRRPAAAARSDASRLRAGPRGGRTAQGPHPTADSAPPECGRCPERAHMPLSGSCRSGRSNR
jgi:hypothetical protein